MWMFCIGIMRRVIKKFKLGDDYDDDEKEDCDDEEDYDDDDEEGIDFARQAGGVIRRPSTLGSYFSSVSSDNRNMRADIIIVIITIIIIIVTILILKIIIIIIMIS